MQRLQHALIVDAYQKQPLGGTVCPAWRRSQAASTSAGQHSSRAPLPTFTSVPTIARTMLYKKSVAGDFDRHAVGQFAGAALDGRVR